MIAEEPPFERKAHGLQNGDVFEGRFSPPRWEGNWSVSEYHVTLRRGATPEELAMLEKDRQRGFIELGNECWSPVPYASQFRGNTYELIFPIEVVEQSPYMPAYLTCTLPLGFAHAALMAHRAMYRNEKLVNALSKVGMLTRASAYGRGTIQPRNERRNNVDRQVHRGADKATTGLRPRVGSGEHHGPRDDQEGTLAAHWLEVPWAKVRVHPRPR